jgi:glycosyltransferase involved in cell wall biosynthesis
LISIAHSYCVALNRRLVNEIAEAGKGTWEVTAVSPSHFYGDLRPIPMEPAEGESCSTKQVKAYFTRRTHFMLYEWRLRELLRQGWDLVHCWEEPYILCGGQIAMWTPDRTPMVFYTLQNISKQYPIPFSWIENYTLNRCAGWLACGESIVDAMLKRGYGGKPYSVIPLGVDLEQFHPDLSARRHVLQELGWAGAANTPVIGFLGRFVPEKGITFLMNALDNVSSPWRVLFVGDGPLKKDMYRWGERHPGRVRIQTGIKHDQVAAYLNAMDLLCAPSQTTSHWREQFGRMIAEAFACGVPVIASDSGEIPWVVGNAGVIAPEGDSLEWTRAIEEMLAAPEQRRELAKRGLERVHALYSWKVLARKYLDFFDRTLDGNH